MKKIFLMLLPLISSLYACSNSIEVTAIAVKLVRNYDENNNYINSYFEEFDNKEYKHIIRFEKGHIFSVDDMQSLNTYLLENTPDSCTTTLYNNQGYSYIEGYYYDLNMLDSFIINTKIENNFSIYYALIN